MAKGSVRKKGKKWGKIKGTACGDGKERHHGIRCADC